MANGDSLDVNSMYSILKDIFNREYNENYANRNRSNFAGGLADLRNGWAAMQNARKNKRDQAEYKNSMGGGENPYRGTLLANGNGVIGATGDGIYGVNSMPPQPNGVGIGVDANGVYGVEGTPQPNQFKIDGGGGFDWSKVGQMPTENSVMSAWGNQGGNPTFGGNGGFDWSKAPSVMPNGNSVMDAWGKQGSMFSGMGGEKESDHGMNITDQTIGQNYNNRINSQYGADKSGGMTGMNFPQSPQGNGGFNSVFNVANANPQIPSISSNNLAQGIGGQNVSANDLSRYLGNEYNRARWIQEDMANNGVTNPLISMLRYDTKVAPLINAAKEEELRNAFFTLNNPNASEQDRMNAMALIEFRKGDPFLEENYMAKLGYVPDDGYGGYSGYGEDGGEYGGEDENARAIYNHLVSKGLPANVIAGIMGNLQAESGFNSSAVGDGGNSIGLAQWYAGRGDNLRNFAQQRGTEWNDVGTQLDFLLDEVAKGNPELLNRMANLSPHEAAILFHDEFEKSADTPEMKARRGDYATDIYNGRRQGNGGTRRSRWRQNPYKMTPMQKMQYAHDLKMEEIAARNGYKTSKTGKTGTTVKDMTDNEYGGITGAISSLNAENGFTPENGEKLASSLINEYRRAFDMAGDQYGAAEILYKSLMNGSKFGEIRVPKGVNKEDKVAAIVADAVSQAHRRAGMAQDVKNYLLNTGKKQTKVNENANGSTTQTNGNNSNIIQAPIDRNTVVDEESATRAQNNSFFDKVGYAIDKVGNAIKVDKYNDKPIGANKFGDDWDNTWNSIAERNKQESKKRKEQYEEKKKREESKRRYLEATR